MKDGLYVGIHSILIMFQYHPYFLYLSISALVILIVLFLAWRRSAPGSLALKGLLLGMFIWSAAYAITWAAVPLTYKVFWLKVMFTGVVMIPGLFLVFTLHITHRESWLTFRNIVLLLIEPLIMLALVWGVPRLVFEALSSASYDGYIPMEVLRGTWFRVNTIYSYVVVFFSFVLIGLSYRDASIVFKRQYLIILISTLAPFAFGIYSELTSLTPGELDRAPIVFGLSGFLYAYALFRHQLMDLVPIARSRLIENMSDGVLVLDAQGRIVDINPAMRNFLNAEPLSFIGKNISEVLNIWNESTEYLLTGLETRTELRLPNQSSRYLDLRVTPLYDEDKALNGRLIVFRDITDRKEVEKDLRHAMDRMQTQLIEIGLLQSQLREQAIRDALTNLFNRRYLDDTLERELARARREEYPLCIVMMDIDHFKNVNDEFGHEAGDVVLKTLAQTVTSQSRQGDFVCRYGGEEFVLVMPNITADVARERVSTLHRSITNQIIPYGQRNLKITVSMGLSWFPSHGDDKDELLRAADKALYAAKRAGRNRVYLYRGPEESNNESGASAPSPVP